jgi:uncharacterized protein (DUF433 family)
MTIHFGPNVQAGSLDAHVTVDTNSHGGVPCVAGGRWPIAHILRKLASGYSHERLIHENPELRLADIQLALNVAAWTMCDPAIDWTSLDLPAMVDFQYELQAWQGLSDEALRRCEDSLES